MTTAALKRPDLRQQALLRLGAPPLQPDTPDSTARTLHELQVHQVELEIQNEELLRAQDELRESEARYRLLSEMATDCVLWIAPDSSVRYASPACATVFGHPPEAFMSDPGLLPRLVHPADRAVFHDHVRSGSRDHGVAIEFRIVDADGGVRWISHHCQLMVDERRQRLGWRSTNTDITAKRRDLDELNEHRQHLAELVQQRTAELTAAKAMAEAANAAKDQFLANMSHEIRTPLNGMLGMVQLLRRSGLSPQQEDHLGKFDVSARHLLDIINDILDLSKIEAGKLAMEPHDFDLGTLLDELGTMIGDLARSKGLAFAVNATDLPQGVCGDSLRLRQALLNYLANAVKFTASGGITLSVRALERSAQECLLRFEVSDSGIGIAPDRLVRIFDAFEQGDDSTTRAYGGTGLGLAITRRIAQLMGGDTGVASAPGLGSSFWLTVRLGLHPGAPRAPAPPPVPDAETLLRRDHTGARVLLVEDDEVSREVAQYLLNAVGLQVDSAANGLEAVSMACNDDYRLILMDMQMPVMDGLSAARQIRTLPGRAGLPIIALTANALGRDRQRCLDAGMSDFVSKPLDAPVLFETLLRWLSRH